MLETFERAMWILGGLIVAGLAAAFLLIGPPSWIPDIATQSVRADDRQIVEGLDQQQRQAFEEKLQAASKARSASGSSRAAKVPVRSEKYLIDTNTFERVRNLNDALYEAKRISSEVVVNDDGTNSLKIFDFAESSPLGTLGFEESDVIDYIDGKKIDFTDVGAARGLYADVRDTLATGVPIVIDVTRNGRPVQVVVRVGR